VSVFGLNNSNAFAIILSQLEFRDTTEFRGHNTNYRTSPTSPLPTGLLDRLEQRALARGAAVAGVAGHVDRPQFRAAAFDALGASRVIGSRRVLKVLNGMGATPFLPSA